MHSRAVERIESVLVKYLLDTCTFLWAITDAPQLSHAVRSGIVDPANEVWVSTASFWEITIKFGLGKIRLPDEPDRYLPAQCVAAGFDLLAINEAEVCQVHRLPAIHRDPFDRILVAQANCHGLVIATCDPIIQQYPVQTCW